MSGAYPIDDLSPLNANARGWIWLRRTRPSHPAKITVSTA